MASSNVAAAAGLAIVYAILRLILRWTQDPREPPAVLTSIPFVGAILGMTTKRFDFYVYLKKRFNLPICTLRMPGTRIYVVNDTALIQAVQKQERVISFAAVQCRAADGIIGVDQLAHDIITADIDKDGSYLQTFPKAMAIAGSPGPNLDDLNRAAITYINETMRDWKQKGTTKHDLYRWSRHEIVMATTEAVYGPLNPFRSPDIEKAWNAFEQNIMIFVLKLFPSIFAKKAYQGRERVAQAFKEYFAAGGQERGSSIIQARCAHNASHGLGTVAQFARIEVGGAFANVAYTNIACFWMVFHVFSDPIVLEDCRRELNSVLQIKDDHRVLNISDLKTSCPIMQSLFQEVLRYHGVNIATRVLLNDHMLDNRFLLKKGATLMIPGNVQHTDPSIWGADSLEFNHKRFLRGSKRTNPTAFRTFGGGSILCPGRHFASTEIIGFAAAMALTFDVIPTGGRWVKPKSDNASMTSLIRPPDNDIEVLLQPLQESELRVVYSGTGNP